MKSRKSFPLRVSHDLYQEVSSWAEQELRSVNGQIEFILKEAVRRRKRDSQKKRPSGSERQGDKPAEKTQEE